MYFNAECVLFKGSECSISTHAFHPFQNSVKKITRLIQHLTYFNAQSIFKELLTPKPHQ